MAQSEILKELFVNLTYRIDANSEKKFQTATRNAVIQAELIVKAFEMAAKAFVHMLESAAKGMDALFYASDRIGASVGNIKSFSNAVAQLGGTVEGAQSSLENFGKFIRLNPGALNFIKNLGVDPSGDKVEVLERLVQHLSRTKTYPVQMLYAQQFGIDENTWRAMASGEFGAKNREQKSILARLGLDPQKMAEDGRAFANAWRNVETVIEAITDKVLINFLGEGGKGLKVFAEFLAQHGQTIAKTISDIAQAFVDLAKEILGLNNQDDPDKVIRQIGESVEAAAKATEHFIQQVRELLSYLVKFNEASKDWWITRFLNYSANGGGFTDLYNATNGKGAEAASGMWGGVKGWWGRHAPSWLGGGNDTDTNGTAQRSGMGGKYSAAQAAALIREAGGTEEEATILGAIAMPESRGNPNAHNPNAATGDNSYGLWQINMLGGMGPERRARFGLNSNNDLYDPKTNARVALAMYRAARGARDWSTYRSGAYRAYIEAARRGARGDAGPSFSLPSFIGTAAAEGAHNPYGALDVNGIRAGFERRQLGASPSNDNSTTNNSTQHVTQNNSITVNGGGSNPHDQATALSHSMARSNRGLADLIRNTNGAAQ